MTDSGSGSGMRLPRNEPSSWAPWLAWLAAALLGAFAVVLYQVQVPILTEESPLFTLWQAPVLLCFVLFGPKVGLLSALIALGPQLPAAWVLHPALGMGAMIYVVEAVFVALIFKRLRSVVMATTLFWVTFGWLFDLLIYVYGVGLEPEYVAILLAKQVLNSIVYAALVDLAATRKLRVLCSQIRGEQPVPIDIQGYAFRGLVVLAVTPFAIGGVFYVRAEFSEVRRTAEHVNSELAFSTANLVLEELDGQRQGVRTLARRLSVASTDDEKSALLLEHLESRPRQLLIAVVDEYGRVVSSQPAKDAAGQDIIGLSVADREYFQKAQTELRTIYSDLVIGKVSLRSPSKETGAVIVEPILGPLGRFEGALLGTLDLVDLQRSATPKDLRGRLVTLIDAEGRILSSTDPTRSPGTKSEDLFHAATLAEIPNWLKVGVGAKTLSYYPAGIETMESRLGLDLIHSRFQPIKSARWGVLVDLPAMVLHAQLLPAVLRVLGGLVLMSILAFVVISGFSRRLAAPVRAAATAALQVRQGRLDSGLLAKLESSHLLEISLLVEGFVDLDRYLHAQRSATAEREEDLQVRLAEAQKMEAIGLLAGGVAHDFNNLLMPILGYADLGLAGARDDRDATYYGRIVSAAEKATELTGQLLAFGRRQVLDIESVDLIVELENCRPLLHPLLRENIHLEIERAVALAPALVDTGQFHRVLFNLALNAQDAMPDGGTIRLVIDSADSQQSAGANDSPGRFVRISVHDEGQGIPVHLQSKVFEPFYSTKSEGKGCGLGLATVHGIAHQHGGFVELESTPGEGSSFHVYLPEGESKPPKAKVAMPSRGQLAGSHILVVEDDPDVGAVVSAYLQKSGCQVTACDSAESAIELLKEQNGQFSAMITDVVLPALNGRQLFERALAIRPNLPTLFISGYDHEVLQQGIPEGCELLRKPFNRESLLGCLERVLSSGPNGVASRHV